MKTSFRNLLMFVAALLMGMPLAGAMAERSGAEQLTGFVPPDGTLGFVATSGGDELKGAFDRSRLGMVWHEASVQEFYGKVRGEVLKLIDAKMKEEDQADAKKLWSAMDFVKTILQRPTLIGVGEKAGQKVPVYGFMIVKAGERKAQIQELLTKFEESNPQIKDEKEVITIGNTQIFKAVKDDVVFLWGWVEDYFVISVNDAEARLFQRLTSASLDDLRAAKFPGLEKVAGTNDLAIKYVNVEGILKLVTSEAAKNGAKDEDLARIQNVLMAVGASSVTTATARGGFSGQNMVGDALLSLRGERGGIFKTLGTVEMKDLDKVPAGAMMTNLWNMDLGGIYDVVMAGIRTSDEGKYAEVSGTIAKFEKESGFQIRQGLLASLDGEMLMYQGPAMGVMGTMSANGVFLIKLKDVALFKKTVEAFEAYVTKKEVKEFQIMDQEVNGRTYTVVMIPQLAMMQVSPTWTVEGNWVIVGANMMQVNTALHAATQPAEGGSIRQTAGFKAVTASLPEKLVCFRYDDQKMEMGQTMQTLQQFWPMVVMTLQKNGQVNLPMMLPPAEDIVKHLGPAADYMWFDTDGLRYHGEGAIVAGNAQMVAGAAVVTAVTLPALKRAREMARRALSGSNLKQIGLACLMFANDHKGQMPASLDELVSGKYIKKDAKYLESPIKPKEFSGPAYVYNSIPVTIDKIKEPANFVVVYENTEYQKYGTNVFFADGHVAWMKPAEFRKALEKTFNELGKAAPSIRFQGEKIQVPMTQPSTAPAGSDVKKITPSDCRDVPCGETAGKDEKKSVTAKGESKS